MSHKGYLHVSLHFLEDMELVVPSVVVLAYVL